MTSYRLSQRAVIVGGVGLMIAATGACGSSSGGSPTAAPPSVSSAPITSEAVPTEEEATPAAVEETSTKKPKSKKGTASVKSVCGAVEPALNKALNDMIANGEPAKRPALNKAFNDLAGTARKQADRSSNAKLSAALEDIAQASEDFTKVKDVSTAEKEGEAFQKAVKRAAAVCKP